MKKSKLLALVQLPLLNPLLVTAPVRHSNSTHLLELGVVDAVEDERGVVGLDVGAHGDVWVREALREGERESGREGERERG
jgi:hypothetical protein